MRGHGPRKIGNLRTSLCRPDTFCLRALLAFADFKLHPLPLIECAVSLALNGGPVDKDVVTRAVHRNKAVALFSVEPLHGSQCHDAHSFSSVRKAHATVCRSLRTEA